MKIFISSLIAGMEAYRAAAKSAIESLGFEAVMAEDFGAQPASPQVACLQGLRSSDAVVLILGDRYGYPQHSGLSPTHEEFREARETRPIFAFKLAGIVPEADQQILIEEAGGWSTGLFREEIDSPTALGRLVTQRLHEWTVARSAGTVDEQDLVNTALGALPERRRGFYTGGQSIAIAVAGGPRQAVLRPSDMDSRDLHDAIKQAMLFGPRKLFADVRSLDAAVDSGKLVLRYDGGKAQVSIDGRGTMFIMVPLTPREHGLVMIEEDVRSTIDSAFSFADWIIEKIDSTQRLTHVAPIVAFLGDNIGTWMSEQEFNSRSTLSGYPMNMNDVHQPVVLEPPSRPRPALRHQRPALVDDFVALLRRQMNTR
ncbi:DUF4062 domain-containing protein [Luteibacter sp. SG786]|uniref:DUF4062 domain-containing protein n=1 Tax=Luteibacter sp. SG786 TaxID=2587130 RepID=UPI00141F5413|nr:DUF4062 domain-containing protein [Luteibacter sp. SG786]NII55821.1 hypothetical protein [Luteibacter sp. SG786]